MNKNWERVYGWLRQDYDNISELVSNSAEYESRLEQICTTDDATCLAQLREVFDETLGTLDKYSQVKKLDTISPGLETKLLIAQNLQKDYIGAISRISNDFDRKWQRAKKRYNTWEQKYGHQELLRLRDKLNELAQLYQQLRKVHVPEKPEVKKYIAFVEAVTPLESELAQLGSQPRSEPECHIWQRDREEIEERYQQITSRFRHMESPLFAYSMPVTLEEPNDWEKIYQESITYLETKRAVTRDHLERLAEMELCENPQDSIAKLDRRFRDMFQKEYYRVVNELDNRFARASKGTSLDELEIMYKTIGLATENISRKKEQRKVRKIIENLSENTQSVPADFFTWKREFSDVREKLLPYNQDGQLVNVPRRLKQEVDQCMHDLYEWQKSTGAKVFICPDTWQMSLDGISV